MYEAVEAGERLWDVVYDDGNEIVGSICKKSRHFTAYGKDETVLGQADDLDGAVALVAESDYQAALKRLSMTLLKRFCKP